MNKFFKKIFFFILGVGKIKLTKGASILMYHSVGENQAFFTVSVKNFSKQMAYLKCSKRIVVKLTDLVEKIIKKENISGYVCLTFDDGYLDNLTHALPILKKYNFPATIFVATNFIGGQMCNSENRSLPIISSEEIKINVSSQLEFLPHTSNHKLLNLLKSEDYNDELLSSRLKIEELTGQKGEILAYPKGLYSKSIIEYLKSNQWRGAVTVQPGLVELKDNLFELKRNAVVSSTSLSEFKIKVSDRLKFYLKFKTCLKYFFS